jgi:hypothetical protein
MKMIAPRTGFIAVLGIFFLAGCNPGVPRPQISFDPETVQFGNVIINPRVNPNGTSITEIRIEWGRRPSSANAVSVPATDFFENNGLRDQATNAVIQLPYDNPFTGQFDFRFSEFGQPLQEGNIVDYQIRVTHTTPDGGTLFFWSQRQHFTYHAADVPNTGGGDTPPVAGGGGGQCSNETQRVSIHTGSGSIDNTGGAKTPAASGDGSVIAFASPVGFEPNDTNNGDDIYIHDREENETIRVSIHTGSGSITNNGGAKTPTISDDGNIIAFATSVGFDSNDNNNADDIYIHDRQAGKTTRVSIHTGSGSINNTGEAKTPAISADGNFIAFASPVGFETNDNNNADDIYLHDRTQNETTRVSIHTGSGSIDNTGAAKTPSVSEDGSVIAFVSPVGFETNDNNNADDVYVHDRTENETTRVSIHTGSGSIDNTGGAKTPSISADGNIIAFVSPVAFDPDDVNNTDDVYIHCR